MFVVAVVPLALNWREASRRHGPDARLAADFAYDLLNSTPPYGILFTFGDNDTFPLWWAQEVGGVRQDVTVICLALANTDWYMRQLRDAPARPLDVAALLRSGATASFPRPTAPLHTMTDSMVQTAMSGYLVRGSRSEARPADPDLTDGAILYPNESWSGRAPAEPRPTADRLGCDGGRTFAGLGPMWYSEVWVRAGDRVAGHGVSRSRPAQVRGVPHRRPTRPPVFETYRSATCSSAARTAREHQRSVAATMGFLPPSWSTPTPIAPS